MESPNPSPTGQPAPTGNEGSPLPVAAAAEQSSAPVCVTCGTALSDKFCSHCGEKVVGPDDYSLKHFAEQSLDLLTHFDFKFFRSAWLLVSRPGFLTERYLAGNRKPYLKPLQLFILINVLYFITLHFFGADTFTSPLAIHVENGIYGRWAENLVDAKLVRTGEPRGDYARRFDAQCATAAKSLIFLIIPMYAGLLAMLHARSRRFLVEHVVFATHFMAATLVFMFTAINLVIVLMIDFDTLDRFDLWGTRILEVFIFLYFFLGLPRVYGTARWLAAVQTLALIFATQYVIILYRFLLFGICYLTT